MLKAHLSPVMVQYFKLFSTRALITAVFLLVAASSCRKNEETQIPVPPVDFSVNINNPQYIALKSIGGWVYVTGGSKGIILYRSEESNINAFDRHSPFEVNRGCQVSVDSSDIAAIDTCSNSRFLLQTGNPISGPATQPLFSYQTNFNGQNLRVFN